jgi:hypothetical protein
LNVHYSFPTLNLIENLSDLFLTFIICRLLSLFSDSYRTVESDDIHAALALMYGYAAKYAPSSVIEARINALVVGYLLLSCFISDEPKNF